MSLRCWVLNKWLRRVEKRRLRHGSPATLRRALEVQSRLFFHPPWGTKITQSALGAVPALTLRPKQCQPDRVLFYIHGGGFVFGSPETHSAMVAQLAQRIGAKAVLPRYRRAPEAPFPAAADDIRSAWDALMSQGVAPSKVVLGGDSAGGALAFGLIATLCAEGAGLPGAVFGFSPLTDLTHSGESFATNAARDVLLPAERAPALTEMYLHGHPPTDPRASPLFGSFVGAPPAWVTVGDTEILRDDAVRLVAALHRDGADATLVERHDLPHVWPIFHNVLPEGRETLDALAVWIRERQGWQS